ncbi:30S ribosomal protein S6 [candidate division NPL-UPA2 bacterium]|nr:30S ribosomal protein S6 [candidate division NPL-UPA2 bacterium]
MADYEGIFIIDAKLGEKEVEKAIVGVEEVIGKNEGKVEKRDSWGKKNLAYEVRGRKEGFYFVVNFQAEPRTMRELEKPYRLNEAILRHLILRRTRSDKRTGGTEQERKTV